MLSVIDELCMPTYTNVHSFHWILLIIKVDDWQVEVMDSLNKNPKDCASLVVMFRR
jgi:Ulp1 family protease